MKREVLIVFVEGYSITFELFGVPRHGGRLPFFPTQPGWISGVYLTGARSVTLDEFDRIINGDGDEIELQLTNGARMTGAEFLAHKFASIGYATIVHPVEGPINSYRAERAASWKQRLTLCAETQTCSRPGCNKPADYCQVHHIIPWQAGGYTNIKNLTFLCAYHNGINDDDPSRPTGRGYVFRIPGGITYIPPWGLPITATPEYQQAAARLTTEQPPGTG